MSLRIIVFFVRGAWLRGVIVTATVLVLAASLTGCVGSVKLRHPTTKQEVKCGPYAFMFGHGVDNLNRCLDDYQRQGYERVP
jgi:hypothetical protein